MDTLFPERLIGTGSNGAVYLARDSGGRRFALKILEGTTPAAQALWENEVSFLAKLRHPHLVEIAGFSRDGHEVPGHQGHPCYWMEFIDGGSLTDAAKRAAPSQVADWLRQALEALAYLHAQGVLHGDLKPSNILIGSDGRLKLVDFGFATILRGGPPRAGDVRGSLPYLPPESLDGVLQPASDLFALGISFYEAFAGVHPRANARDLVGLYAEPARPLERSGIDLPPRVAKVVDRAIVADRDIRWKSAREALAALDQDRPRSRPTKTPGPIQSFRLFGRDGDRETLGRFLKACGDRDMPALVLVHGAPGVGKTRFVQELYYDWMLQGIQAVTSRPPPEGPLLPPGETVRIITDAEVMSPSHLADLHHFLRSSRGSPEAVVLEYNDERLPPFLQDVFDGLRHAHHVLDLPLTNLGRDDSIRLLRALVPSPIDDRSVEAVLSLAEGNPKLLTLVSQELGASASTRLKRGGIPKTVDSFFENRLHALKRDEGRVLSFLAAAAQPGIETSPASLDDLVALTQVPAQEMAKILNRLMLAGLVRRGGDGPPGYQIVHPALSQAVGRSLSATERAGIHEQWTRLLESQDDAPDRVIALAAHVTEIPSHPKRMEWLLRAADILRTRGNEAAAAGLYEKGLALPGKGEARETLLRNLANAYGRMGDFKKSKAAVERWFEDYPSDPLGLNPVKYGLSTGIACKNLGETAEAIRRLRFALQSGDPSSEPHRPYLARVHSLLGLIALESSDFPDAATQFEAALAFLSGVGELQAEVYKHRAMMAAKRGAWTEAHGELDHAERIYAELGHTQGLFAVLLERGNLALKSGRADEASAAYQKALEAATRANDEPSLARVFQNLGLLAAEQGDLARSLQEFERARELLIFFGSPRERALNLLELGLAHAAVGNFATGRRFLAESERTGDSIPDLAVRTHEARRRIDFLEKGIGQDECPVSPDALEVIYRKLPDALKIGFEERFDYKMGVARKTGPLPQEADMEILQKMHAITRDLFASNDMGRILERIMDAAMEISKAERGFLLVPGGDAGGPLPGFEVRIARNLARERIGDEETRISLSAVREALRTGQTLVTDNALKDARFLNAPSVQNLDLKSILVLPLKGTEGLLGAIYLDHRYEAQIFRGADLQVFADQAALALQKAKMIERLETSNQTLSHTVAEQTDELAHLRREVDGQRDKLAYEYREIVGRSPKMQEVLFLVDRLIESSIPVWIFGESGTGKEMIARALHFKGPRRKKPFVSENCSALPEQLLESELFGHKRGAFTHADRDKKGLLQYADGGTVFLDEIADTSPTLQAKLLRFLQEKEFRPVGSNEVVRVDVRIVSASNKDLGQLVREGKFREDLFYRLNGVTVHLPPLRDRLEDIPLLARHFLKKVAEAEKKAPLEVGADAMEILMGYPWPGNVRELENTLQTACLFAVKGRLTSKSFHFKKALLEGAPETASPPPATAARPAKTGAAPQPGLTEDARIVLKALQDNCYHKGLAAKQLGITRRYLYKKLVKLGIPVDRIKMKAFIESGRIA